MITAFILLLTSLSAFSVEQSTNENSSISFTVVNAGFEVSGTLQIACLDIRFDPRNLWRSSVLVKVDPSSIKTGISVRDKHLKRSDYFDVGRYPEIQLKSISFKKTGRSAFVGRFDLTIKGITKIVEIPFTAKKDGSGTLYEVQFELNRLDFKLGEHSVILEDDVVVSARIRY
jgi:polyisoprenoid-binding protein YceI